VTAPFRMCAIAPFCAVHSSGRFQPHSTLAPLLAPDVQILIAHPYPKDVHIEDESEDGDRVQMYRTCSAAELEQHGDPLLGGKHAAGHHWNLLNFELAMFLLLGVALPIVHWRKIRIRHL
jgi:hypothetical protein